MFEGKWGKLGMGFGVLGSICIALGGIADAMDKKETYEAYEEKKRQMFLELDSMRALPDERK